MSVSTWESVSKRANTEGLGYGLKLYRRGSDVYEQTIEELGQLVKVTPASFDIPSCMTIPCVSPNWQNFGFPSYLKD